LTGFENEIGFTGYIYDFDTGGGGEFDDILGGGSWMIAQ